MITNLLQTETLLSLFSFQYVSQDNFLQITNTQFHKRSNFNLSNNTRQLHF